MKLLILALAIFSWTANSNAQIPAHLRLAAILHSPTETIAIFDDKGRTTTARLHDRFPIGSESVTLAALDPKLGSIRLETKTNNRVFQLQKPPNLEGFAFAFEDASIDHVLLVFSRLTRRTTLPHPLLPKTTFTFTASFTEAPQAAVALAQEFAKKEIAVKNETDKFSFILPKSLAENPALDRSKILKPRPSATVAEIGQGEIELYRTPLIQVLEICGAYLGVELDPNAPSPPFVLLSHDFRSATSLSAEEASFALQTLLLWHGFQLVLSSEDKLKAIRLEGR